MSAGPLLVAHRAGNDPAGVAPAIAAGADVIEIDVHLHRGRLEVRHPRRFGPVLWDRHGVRLARTRSIPALGDVLARLPAGAVPMIDLKQGPASLAERAVDACRAAGVAEVYVASRRWALVDRVATRDGVHPVYSAAGARELDRLLARGRGPGPHAVCARRDLLDADRILTILRTAPMVMTWAVDDDADAVALGGWGVGALICDDLALVARLRAARGQASV